MSPRAAWRLDGIGFEEVYDYVAGKVDWLAMGLPSEGDKAGEPRAGAARRDVPRCRPDDDLDVVREAVGSWETCMVVNSEGVLLGRLGRASLREASGRAESAMTEGPSTVRPNAPLAGLVERMHKHRLTSYPVTTADGRLVGLVMLDDVQGTRPPGT